MFPGLLFVHSRRRSRAVPPEAADVCLWPDTFTNHFRPQALHAAARVLEHAGCRIALPTKLACCGRPLYAEGMLDLARKQLAGLMSALGPVIERALPIVGLEPSCVAVFRDELPGLFPNDPRAHYLKEQTFTFAQYLRRRKVAVPSLHANAIVHMHCNQRAVLGAEAELAVLEQLFDDSRVPEPDCCGMAGPFGFDASKYDLSLRIAERALLPAVRSSAADTWLIADGFSCREQIRQATGREPIHLAQAVWQSLQHER